MDCGSAPVNELLSRSAIAAVPSIGRAVHVERAARDADATQDLFERYSGQIFGFCVNNLGSRDEAEDALQTTFLNAHRALQRGVTPETELAWLFKIAHNVCLTRRRSSRRRGRVESPSDFAAVQDVMPAPSHGSPDDLLRLTEALEHMPDNQRRAILLREWQGLSYHEIAEELELSQSAVETLIFRARRTLASNLEAELERPSAVSRMRRLLDAGTLLAALKGLFGGGAAAKVAAVAVAASGTVVLATAPPSPVAKPAPKQQAVMSVPLAVPAAPVAFEHANSQSAVASGIETKLAAARSALQTEAKVPAAAAQAPRAVPVKQKAKDEPKATPPGQAKKHEPAVVANGNTGKDKQATAKPANLDQRPAQAQPPAAPPAPAQAPAPAQPVAPEPQAAASNGQAAEAEKDKGSKK